MLLLQFTNSRGQRQIGILAAGGKKIQVIDGIQSTYDLASAAILQRRSLQDLAVELLSDATTDFDELAKEGRLLPPLDHYDPAHCYVTGTGLTHLGSADARDAMHKKLGAAD